MTAFDKVIGGQYGIMKEIRKLVFIKTGRGGSICGFQNKYLDVAEEIRNHLGFAVTVSANPVGSECNLVSELNDIVSSEGEFEEICFVGISNGAIVGAQQGWKCDKIKRMLLINGSLMINWHKTKKGLEKFMGEKALLLYGSLDPSYAYVGLLDFVESDICSYETLDGIDHNFTDNVETLNFKILMFLDNDFSEPQ